MLKHVSYLGGNPNPVPRKINGIIFNNIWGLRKKVLMFFTKICFGKMKEIQRLKYFGVSIHNLRKIFELERQKDENKHQPRNNISSQYT